MPELLRMFKKNTKERLLLVATFVLVLGADQLIKYNIRSNGGFYICNPGISLGIQLPTFAFWLILAIFLFFAISHYETFIQNFKQNKLFFVFLGLFLSGLLSNLLDRFLFDCIIDYIFPFWQKLPVFNLADVAIFFGVSGLILLTHKKHTIK
ncbi:MAG: hypothetical protein ACD_9C00021G0004 [uncultured bacterium]|nr:MAG: hypothetical protein ACD_9C00021G0004 [uncultured bacterium]